MTEQALCIVTEPMIGRCILGTHHFADIAVLLL